MFFCRLRIILVLYFVKAIALATPLLIKEKKKTQKTTKTGFCCALDHVVTCGLGDEISFLRVLIISGAVHLLKKKKNPTFHQFLISRTKAELSISNKALKPVKISKTIN